MDVKAVTITGALVAVVITIIYAIGDYLVGLLSPELVAHWVGLAWKAGKALLVFLLCWPISAFGVEGWKWQFIVPDLVDPDGTPHWTSFRARRAIRGGATMGGGLLTTGVLLAVFWPPTFLGGVLCVVAGFGLGGLALPEVHDLWVDFVWPRLKVLGAGAVKWVRRKDGSVDQVPVETPPDEYDETLLPGRAPERTEPNPSTPPKPPEG